jgi:hypothetical protein
MLVVCASCSRHIRAEAERCPFCTTVAPARGLVPLVALAMVASMSTAACYGGPRGPGSPRPEVEAPPVNTAVAAPDSGAQVDGKTDKKPDK